MGMLEGRVAIVTGGGRGIGRAEAICLAAQGAAVVVNDLGDDAAPGDGHSAEAVVAEIRRDGGRAVADRSDVSDWAVGSRLVDQAVGEFGRLDIVVANAGIVRRNPIVEVTQSELDAQVGVLFTGTFSLIHHAARQWKSDTETGRRSHRSAIVTSSSAGVPGGVQEFSVYGALKAGLAALALGAALELRPYDVTVNAILPHAATRMDAWAKGQPAPADYRPGDPDPGNPEHVANVVSYLVSERAAWLSGQVFEISGTTVRRWLPWSPHAEIEQLIPWNADALDEALATAVYGTLPGGRVVTKAAEL